MAETAAKTYAVKSDNTSDTTPTLVAVIVDAAGNSRQIVIAVPWVATAALSNVAAAVTTGVVLAANAARTGAYFYNDSSSACYLAYAATASTSAFTVKIPANSLFEMPPNPVYQGVIAALWDTATGNLRVTELT